MRARSVVAVGVLALLVGGSSEEVGAAVARDCPECRREYNDTLCRIEEVHDGERVITTYFFWSDGVK